MELRYLITMLAKHKKNHKLITNYFSIVKKKDISPLFTNLHNWLIEVTCLAI